MRPGKIEVLKLRQCSRLFSVELCIEEVEEEVDIDLGGAEHVSDGHTLVLQLQQLLREKHTHFSNNHGCGVGQIECGRGSDQDAAWVR
jgi:hypothetical protein